MEYMCEKMYVCVCVYNFTMSCVCAFRCSDGGIFAESELREGIENGSLNLPEPEPYAEGLDPQPFAIVADAAFPLRTWLMKPFPQRGLEGACRIYNYRLSRARRIVENAFGILGHR